MHSSLIDSFQRPIQYIRLSVTERCDLRCMYCMPEDYHDFEASQQWLSFTEIERVVAAFAALGVNRVRITGGEPLLRRNLSQLVLRLRDIAGIADFSLSTNAMRLAKLAQPLHDAGVSRLNVSLDSLEPTTFATITHGGKLQKVLDGLQQARQVGFQPIKINMVVMRGINDHEVAKMVEFCTENQFTLRFIETMPVGASGRDAADDHYINLEEIRARLAQQYSLIDAIAEGGGPARYVQIAGTKQKIGFITPISQHFCDTCNRVRIGADGVIYTCLGQEHSVALRPLLQQGISDSDLEQVIVTAIANKPKQHHFTTQPDQVVRFMSQTGG